MITNKIAKLREMSLMAEEFKKAHILFVPMPVESEAEYNAELVRMSVKVMKINER